MQAKVINLYYVFSSFEPQNLGTKVQSRPKSENYESWLCLIGVSLSHLQLEASSLHLKWLPRKKPVMQKPSKKVLNERRPTSKYFSCNPLLLVNFFNMKITLLVYAYALCSSPVLVLVFTKSTQQVQQVLPASQAGVPLWVHADHTHTLSLPGSYLVHHISRDQDEADWPEILCVLFLALPEDRR